ncbi:MAG: hypothetical protein KY475_17605 [Planctomycetes bacterium]|nr:hypothetical protein [Planctomycetota bacterium]
MSINADDILSVTKGVTKKWTAQRKAEERGRSRATREYVYSDRVNFTDVVNQILPPAYEHASGEGKYTVSKRQLYYACRQHFKDQTGRELEYPYFANTLLVQYLNRHAVNWKITADPRGNLEIPNASHKVRIPCGTIEIEHHLRRAGDVESLDDFSATVPTEYPSLAAGVRYQAVLYIEKEGFGPLIKEANLAERFDLAILSCKGQSVTAARRFVDEVCARGSGVPLFVVHDFDKSGFEIAQCLTTVSDWAIDNDRVAYDFRNDIDVTDLGLRLADVEEYGLQSERCKRPSRCPDACTKAEREFLQNGRRVELNAFTAPQFVAWLEDKLRKHLPNRLLPPEDVLEEAYRRSLVVAEINAAIEDATESAIANAQDAAVPKTLRRQVKELMKESPQAWDKALYRLAQGKP